MPLSALVAAVLTGLMSSGGLVWRSTNAVFSATTLNGSNTWTAGAVTIADDDSGSALFSATGLVPSSTGSACIRVTYSGNVTSAVKLYVSASGGTLAAYVNLVVEEGTGGGNTGGFGACGGFSGTTLYSGTLSAFAAASSAYASGVGSFAPTANAQFKVFKFTYTLDAATPSGQQGQSATATFQWESRA